MNKPVLLTTAISYTNGSPHIGHLYESVLADFIKRMYQIQGFDVKLLTGTDEHGKKIAQTAQAQELNPQEICDKYSSQFAQMDKQVQMGWDHWIRTTDPVHKELVCNSINKSIESGDIYLSTYKGWYCVKEETYIPESTAAQTNYINPLTSQPYELVEEPTYMFKMGLKPTVLDRVIPAHFAKGLNYDPDQINDLSISRTTFDWGIKWPEVDSDHVVYVWFDALLNYITGEKILFGDLNNQIKRIHLIGKDIIWFHSVIYPAILSSIGCPLPDQILTHGFVLDSNGRKMSKSLGNIISPQELFDEFPIEAIRFYMLEETVFGSDILFSKTNLISTYNNVLIKSFGNLFQRLYTLLRPIQDHINQWIEKNKDQISNLKANACMTLQHFNLALDFSVWKLELNANLDWANKELTDKKPWVSYQTDPVESIEIFGQILIKFNIACGLMYPAIPNKVQNLISLIGWDVHNIYLSSQTISPINFVSDQKKIIAFDPIKN